MQTPKRSEFRIGAFAALKDAQGRLLLLHRNDRDQWCLPGGLFELGESISECVKRECREEIGVEIEIEGLLGIYSDPKTHLFKFENGVSIHYVTHVFLTRIKSGVPIPDLKESRGMGFFSRSELPPLVPSHRVWIEDAFEPEATPSIR